jgi:hypothetical protein
MKFLNERMAALACRTHAKEMQRLDLHAIARSYLELAEAFEAAHRETMARLTGPFNGNGDKT